MTNEGLTTLNLPSAHNWLRLLGLVTGGPICYMGAVFDALPNGARFTSSAAVAELVDALA